MRPPPERLRLGGRPGAAPLAPRRWRPTSTDSNLLRKVHGERFWLRSRSWVTYWGEWELGFGPWQFSGRLQPCGDGTRVTGRYVPTTLWKLVVALFIAMTLGAVWRTVRVALTTGTVDLQVSFVVVALSAVLAIHFWLGAPYRRHAAEHCLHFLERTLEARQEPENPEHRIEAVQVTTQPPRRGDAEDGVASDA